MILEANSNFKTNQHPVASVLRGVGVLGLIAYVVLCVWHPFTGGIGYRSPR